MTNAQVRAVSHEGEKRQSQAVIVYTKVQDLCSTGPDATRQRMCTPEIVRAMTSRWISDVPSKIV
jgi:hypothetical protein